MGITQFDLEVKSIYPNPSSDFINIPESALQNGSLFKICTMDGRLVKRMLLEKGKTRIDIQDLVKGMYILDINNTRHLLIKQ